MQRVLGAVVVAATTALALAVPPASAHTTVKSTRPANGERLEAAPPELELVFSEPVRDVTVEVESPSGTAEAGAVTEDGAVVTADLPDDGDGQYVVSFSVASRDGHRVAGELRYAVGEDVVDDRRHLGPVEPTLEPVDPAAEGGDGGTDGARDGLLAGGVLVLVAAVVAVLVRHRSRREP